MVLRRNAKNQESPFRPGDVTLLLIPCQVICVRRGTDRGRTYQMRKMLNIRRDILGATDS